MRAWILQPPSKVSSGAVFEMSGAGTAGFNGFYVEAGTDPDTGFLWYTKVGDPKFYVRYDQSYGQGTWLADTDFDEARGIGISYYTVQSSAVRPPAAGWDSLWVSKGAAPQLEWL